MESSFSFGFVQEIVNRFEELKDLFQKYRLKMKCLQGSVKCKNISRCINFSIVLKYAEEILWENLKFVEKIKDT